MARYAFVYTNALVRGTPLRPRTIYTKYTTEISKVPYLMDQITVEQMYDFLWLKFPGENISWKDVKVRG